MKESRSSISGNRLSVPRYVNAVYENTPHPLFFCFLFFFVTDRARTQPYPGGPGDDRKRVRHSGFSGAEGRGAQLQPLGEGEERVPRRRLHVPLRHRRDQPVPGTGPAACDPDGRDARKITVWCSPRTQHLSSNSSSSSSS